MPAPCATRRARSHASSLLALRPRLTQTHPELSTRAHLTRTDLLRLPGDGALAQPAAAADMQSRIRGCARAIAHGGTGFMRNYGRSELGDSSRTWDLAEAATKTAR